VTVARFVAVDWSAASAPKRGRDSIWIADGTAATGAPIELINPRTRAAAAADLDDIVLHGGRSRAGTGGAGATLIALDASLGYPAGTAAALGLEGVPWRSIWSLLEEVIDDDERNRNNRFAVAAELNRRIGCTSGAPAGPFWGAPPGRQDTTLTAHKVPPPGDLAEWRLVEIALRARGLRPFSLWQLLGAGAVGSQTLMAIATFARLLDRWRRAGLRCEVWPFTTGLAVPPGHADVVVVEMWPSLHPLPTTGHPVRDARQVLAAVERLRTAARSGELAGWWTPDLPPAQRRLVETEEGWVLGVS
jgi:precorrin-8X/cobalt-precorrin-8 methylmutase